MVTRFCGHCPHGNHRYCSGPCACATQRHRPDDALAAAMTRYQRLDLRHLNDDVLARAWRQTYRAPEES